MCGHLLDGQGDTMIRLGRIRDSRQDPGMLYERGLHNRSVRRISQRPSRFFHQLPSTPNSFYEITSAVIGWSFSDVRKVPRTGFWTSSTLIVSG